MAVRFPRSGASRRTPSRSTGACLLSGLAIALVGFSPAIAQTDPNPERDEPYPLDAIARSLPPGAELPCSSRGLVRYQGDFIRYARPAQIHPAFRERLRRMERLVKSTAVEIYGRAPSRLLHLGTFNCRRIRAYPDLLSEHALGNAIDVEGFEFGPISGDGGATPALAPRGAFKVRLVPHWDSPRQVDRVHRRFLRTLAQRVIDEPGLFRVALGPAWPGHRNHFHFDCAPYRLVAVF